MDLTIVEHKVFFHEVQQWLCYFTETLEEIINKIIKYHFDLLEIISVKTSCTKMSDSWGLFMVPVNNFIWRIWSAKKRLKGKEKQFWKQLLYLQLHVEFVWFQLLSLCEADDSQLLKLPCYKTVQSLTPLRKSALSEYLSNS